VRSANHRRIERTSSPGGLDFLLAPEPGKGVRAGVEAAIRTAIRDGRLRPGDPLPSTRVLAADLGVGRGSVVEAYSRLIEEGWLVARQGGFTRAAAVPLSSPPPAPVRPTRTWQHDLRPGRADPASFPRSDWAAALRRVLADAPNEAFDYAEWRGRSELRTALAGYLGRARGVRCTAEQVLVCTGAGHGMGLALRAFARVGRRRVAVEDPGAPQLRRIAAAAGLEVVGLPCDERGARVELLAGMDVGAVVVTPAHQFPLGVTLSADRRTRLVAWARDNDAVVVEDDYDGELRYDRQPVGALQALDPDHVIYAGTTSKSLAPALRIGWLVVPPRLCHYLAETSELINAAPSALDQLALAHLITTGGFDRHVRRLRGLYRARRDLLIDSLATCAPATAVTGVSAGGHALVWLDRDGPGEAEVVAEAARRGIALAGLTHFRHPDSLDPAGGNTPALVVGYATPAGQSHRAAISALAAFLAQTS
jgi:GntR family transcriptional regulator / MocR family aminotransferase